MFSNTRRVLSQCNTRLRLLHLLINTTYTTEIETTQDVCIIESVLEKKLQWSSVAILNFLSSFLIMIILCNILNKNCLSLLSLVI